MNTESIKNLQNDLEEMSYTLMDLDEEIKDLYDTVVKMKSDLYYISNTSPDNIDGDDSNEKEQ